jgi:hypothetical protein
MCLLQLTKTFSGVLDFQGRQNVIYKGERNTVIENTSGFDSEA